MRRSRPALAITLLAGMAVACSGTVSGPDRRSAPTTLAPVATAPGPAAGADVWAAPSASVPTFDLGRVSYRARGGSAAGFAVTPEAAWVIELDDGVPTRGRLVRLDPTSAASLGSVGLADRPVAVAAGEGRVWILTVPANPALNLVAVDPVTGAVVFESRIAAAVSGAPPTAHLSVGGGAVWVAVKDTIGGHRVIRFDARSGAVVSTTPLTDAPTAVAFDDGLWVGTETGRLLLLDPTRGNMAAMERAAGHGGAGAAALVSLSDLLAGRSVDDLRRAIGLSHSGGVRVVDRLVVDGLAERRAGADGRSLAVALTAQGRRLAAHIRGARRSSVQDVLAVLDDRERAELTAIAEKLVGQVVARRLALRAAGGHPAGGWLCRLCDPAACERPAGRCPAANAAAHE